MLIVKNGAKVAKNLQLHTAPQVLKTMFKWLGSVMDETCRYSPPLLADRKERVRTALAMRVQLYLWAKEDALMMYCVEDN